MLEYETWKELSRYGLIGFDFEAYLAIEASRRRPFEEQVRRSLDDHAGVEERQRRLLALGSSC